MTRLLTIGLLGLTTGCALFSHSPEVTLRFHEQIEAAMPEKRTRSVDVPGTHQTILVDAFPQLTERDVYDAKLQDTPGGQAVLIHFDLHGANTLTELTTRLRYVVVFVNEKPIAAVLIEHIIANGEFLLEGDLTDAEERKLVDGLNKYAGRWRDFGDTRHAP